MKKRSQATLCALDVDSNGLNSPLLLTMLPGCHPKAKSLGQQLALATPTTEGIIYPLLSSPVLYLELKLELCSSWPSADTNHEWQRLSLSPVGLLGLPYTDSWWIVYSKWLPLFQDLFCISNPGTGGHFCKNNYVTVNVPNSNVSPVTTPHVLSELIGASSSLRHHLQCIHKPLGTAEAFRRLRCNKNLLLSVLARLSVLPPMAAGLSREEQAQEGSLSAFAVVLAVQHYKVFAEHVCIANPKHVKDFLLIFLVQGVHRRVLCQILSWLQSGSLPLHWLYFNIGKQLFTT